MPKVRSKHSKGRPNWLPPHTYMQVYHYCMNYSVYKDEYAQLMHDVGISGMTYDGMPGGNFKTGSATENQAIRLAEVGENIKTIEDAVKTACAKYPALEPYMLQAVTTETNFDLMSEVNHIPCGKNLYHSIRQHILYLVARKRKWW